VKRGNGTRKWDISRRYGGLAVIWPRVGRGAEKGISTHIHHEQATLTGWALRRWLRSDGIGITVKGRPWAYEIFELTGLTATRLG